MTYYQFCMTRGLTPCEETLKKYNALKKLGLI